MMIGILSDNLIVTLFTPDILVTDYMIMLGGAISWQAEVLFVLVQFQPD